MRSHPKKQWKIGTVENCRHHWYLLIWIAYLVLFYIAEHVVTDHYWVSYLPLDDKIPFCRYFIIPYCMWHPLLFAMTLYLMWYDVPAFKRFMVYIGLGFGGSILFCLAFPNGQDLRPTEFAQHDFFIWLLQWVALPLGLLICASTVLVKQHSILDVFVAIPVSVILYFIVYHKTFRTMRQTA